MITFHKAQLEDAERIAYSIIALRCNKKDDRAITTEEVKEWLDHCYYLFDDEYSAIVGIIAAVRILTEDTIPHVTKLDSTTINIQRYEIKYLVDASNDVESLIELVRECMADMNDCVSIYYSDMLDATDSREKALRANGFKYNSKLKCYMRMPAPSIDINMRYM